MHTHLITACRYIYSMFSSSSNMNGLPPHNTDSFFLSPVSSQNYSVMKFRRAVHVCREQSVTFCWWSLQLGNFCSHEQNWYHFQDLTKLTHTRLTALIPGLPGWASTRKLKPIWISLKQETVSGSGISWAICKSAPRSRQITTPVPHHSVFYRPDALPAAQPTASKHWRKS